MRVLLIEDDDVLGAAVRDQIASDGQFRGLGAPPGCGDSAIAGVP